MTSHDADDADKIGQELNDEAQTAVSMAKLSSFKKEMETQTPWFIADKTTSEKKKRRNLRKIAEWIYKDLDIDYGHEKDTTFDGLYRLNVARVNYGAYLYVSVNCNVPLSKDQNQSEHVFRKVFAPENKVYVGADDNPNEFGVIVNDNELSRQLLKWLAMPNSEMDKYIGNNYSIYHRQAILLMLHNIND